MKKRSEKPTDKAHHERAKPGVSADSQRRKRLNNSMHIDAERDTSRSIARMSFELKNRSRRNLFTNFSTIVIISQRQVKKIIPNGGH
jgi:hypothetical protein